MHSPSVEDPQAPRTSRGSLRNVQEAALLFGESGNNAEEPALATDGTGEIVEGKASLPRSSLIFKEEFARELPKQEAKQLTESSSGVVLQILLFFVVALMGALVPQVTSFTKEASRWNNTAQERQPCVNCKKEVPYHPSVQLTVESLVSLFLGILLTYVLATGDKDVALKNAFKYERIMMTAPIAFIYAVGDLAQIYLIGASDGAFFIVTAQLKLMGTAIMTQFVLGKGQTQVQWIMLACITLVCFNYSITDQDKSSLLPILSYTDANGPHDCSPQPCLVKPPPKAADPNQGHQEQAMALAFLKTFLSAVNAVLTERAFKSVPSEPIWVNQVQLKVCSVPFAFSFVILKGMLKCDEGSCVQDTGPFMGFGWKIWFLIACQAFQNFMVGLVYKKMNAIIKYLSTAQSLWIGYFISVYLLKDKNMELELLFMVFLMVLLVISYSLAKAAPASPPAQQPAPPPQQATDNVKSSTELTQTMNPGPNRA